MRTSASTTRRTISPAWQHWRRQRINLRRLIRQLEREVSPHGQKWTDRMVAHYEGRLEELLKAEPPKYLA